MFDVIGYCFLCQGILMIVLVTWLFIETRRVINREVRQRQTNRAPNAPLWNERCTYATISTFFGLSYFGRFYLYEFVYYKESIEFAQEIEGVVVWLFEGVSMGVLMAFHFVNFRLSRSLLSDKEPEYASIMPDEYHRFATEEVDAETSNDESTSSRKDKEDHRTGDEAKSDENAEIEQN